MRQAAAAVQQSGERVREQRAAGHRPGHDVHRRQRGRTGSRRAGPAPRARSSTGGGTAGAGSGTRARGSRCRSRSARRPSAPSESLQGLERPLADVVRASSCTIASCAQRAPARARARPPPPGSRRATWPPTIVAATPPRSVQPPNGVFRDFDRNFVGIDGDLEVRREDRDVGRRPLAQRAARHAAGCARGWPTAARPCGSPRRAPGCTRRSNVSDTAVSSPTMPKGARSNSTRFSS